MEGFKRFIYNLKEWRTSSDALILYDTLSFPRVHTVVVLSPAADEKFDGSREEKHIGGTVGTHAANAANIASLGWFVWPK